jgi:hypothetical protein
MPRQDERDLAAVAQIVVVELQEDKIALKPQEKNFMPGLSLMPACTKGVRDGRDLRHWRATRRSDGGNAGRAKKTDAGAAEQRAACGR